MSYTIEPDLTAEAFLDVLRRSTLAQRRPVEDADKIAGMVARADVIVTARDADGTLLGVARSITDFHYALYCSELCVDEAAQGHGIGKALLAHTVKAAPNCKAYLLLSAPKAVGFYEAAGYTRHGDCFMFA
ncbi:GNAT family N-acetyltransferase [Celeribacter sp.]|uniref:GNAT family N-acetyltransferase n=1 Tax=Celeribacter sp. TaxID=1890673 RepID=UPI003A90F5A8